MEDEIATRWLTRLDTTLKLVSYAQNHEDVLLHRVFGPGHRGFYIDAGANDPVFHSVTRLLYERGWRGINIEPTPSLHRRLEADRPEDVNLNCGVSDAEATLDFHEVAPPLHGWSTFSAEIAASYHAQGVATVARPIPLDTLDRIWDRHVEPGREVDVLKVDVEGFELQVLSGLDRVRHRPRVVLVEANQPERWEMMLLGAGYARAAFDGLNLYYVRGEDLSLLPAFAAPVNTLDSFIPYEYLRLLEIQEGGRWEQFGPVTLAVARRLRAMSVRSPRLAAAVKRAIRRVG